jgi:hypothetical protein
MSPSQSGQGLRQASPARSLTGPIVLSKRMVMRSSRPYGGHAEPILFYQALASSAFSIQYAEHSAVSIHWRMHTGLAQRIPESHLVTGEDRST